MSSFNSLLSAGCRFPHLHDYICHFLWVHVAQLSAVPQSVHQVEGGGFIVQAEALPRVSHQFANNPPSTIGSVSHHPVTQSFWVLPWSVVPGKPVRNAESRLHPRGLIQGGTPRAGLGPMECAGA